MRGARVWLARRQRALAPALAACACAGAWADPPAGGASATPAPEIKQDFFSGLKQGLEEDTDREVVRGHFEAGGHRYYCLVDPKTGKREKNGVAGETYVRRNGMTYVRGAAVSPLLCGDAEQKGLLVTSGYTLQGKAAGSAATAAAAGAATGAAAAVGAAGTSAAASTGGAASSAGGGGAGSATAAASAAGAAGTAGAAVADASGVTGRFYEVRGARIYVETMGHGPPLLFLHGGMAFFDNSFAKQRDYFAGQRTLIGIDQRGHGHSPDGPWTLSYQLMADDTAAIIGQLGLGPVDVIGQSEGGNIALLLARDHPELVRRVIVSGANLRSGLTPEQVREQRALSPDRLNAKLQKLSDSLPANYRPDYGRVSPDGADHWMTLLGKSYFMWIEPVVIEPADLRKIAAPVLVMAGDRDLTGVEETAEIYRGLPHAELFIVPGSGHGTLQTRAELVDPVLREFLEQSTAPAVR